jgi:hypothetical protein
LFQLEGVRSIDYGFFSTSRLALGLREGIRMVKPLSIAIRRDPTKQPLVEE